MNSSVAKSIAGTHNKPELAQSDASSWTKNRHRTDKMMRWLFVGSAVLVSCIIFSIILFVGFQGIQTFKDVNPFTFFFSMEWVPANNQFGTFSFLFSTLALTGLSVLMVVPLAVSAAIFMAKIAPKWMREILRPAAELFVGIPSVVYGLIGLTVIVPWLANISGTAGYGILPAAIVLAVMILPTILSVSEDALRALSPGLQEASLALGATRWQTIWRVLLPAARPGIITGIILGIGRALGETMAVFMVIGNSPLLPKSWLESTTVLTTAIVKDMGNTHHGTAWNNALYMMAFVLLVISLILILAIRIIAKRSEVK
ncbi:phosphate ABC transporter membrane protein, PhoT family [Paenibacillus larvae subsp. larvae]|uniref:Phosphate transport system permease protein n=1 Tax=Paenibacillus larvae subsp. larvae TaxID=147375 RepID=A0A2L1TX79_9BACL|nr:phosphate ABC transporter permease subunit PstC [Paenibacillus larvae]AVF25262.1 phosphate ABC transporter membrane protein, PhoT family [Paenibacillus larvae subsp. larvae]AVF30039.1 phosphate ABC transporter membrane protein, PhoT family [Paenibacillus larvae subsp. larvae]MCY7518741.1 phosphate ABC transporter permease subunit PstC [Paenibacillus larvae]MCY9499925.1 phosphate ABC transporter permease subunit PstC [Paenibacillus larvae]MCY9679514.1 phosphate ABC transporter permease subun